MEWTDRVRVMVRVMMEWMDRVRVSGCTHLYSAHVVGIEVS